MFDVTFTTPQAIDYDLNFTAARLEGFLPPKKKSISSQPISVTRGADQHGDGGLAKTWPLSSSSLRVDGHGLSNTLPQDGGILVADSLTKQVLRISSPRHSRKSRRPCLRYYCCSFLGLKRISRRPAGWRTMSIIRSTILVNISEILGTLD